MANTQDKSLSKVPELQRIDNQQIVLKSDSVLCFLVVKNESIRLPFFLEYYRQKEISNFFVIDNNSSDNTLDLLLQQSNLNIYIWQTKESFKDNKQKWINYLLNQYGQNHWCLILDADEIFYYPNCEYQTIPELCSQLDKQNKNALQIIMLDMYSDKPIKETYYTPGQSFLEVCPYFDQKFYHYKEGIIKNYYWGGLRQRVFDNSSNHSNKKLYCITKFSLVKYHSDMELFFGLHYIKNAKISSTTGCLLHFKYFDFFEKQIRNAIKENQYWQDSNEYKKYDQIFVQNEKITFYDKAISVKLANSQQLIKMGIIHQGSLADIFLHNIFISELIFDVINRIKTLLKLVLRPKSK